MPLHPRRLPLPLPLFFSPSLSPPSPSAAPLSLSTLALSLPPPLSLSSSPPSPSLPLLLLHPPRHLRHRFVHAARRCSTPIVKLSPARLSGSSPHPAAFDASPRRSSHSTRHAVHDRRPSSVHAVLCISRRQPGQQRRPALRQSLGQATAHGTQLRRRPVKRHPAHARTANLFSPVVCQAFPIVAFGPIVGEAFFPPPPPPPLLPHHLFLSPPHHLSASPPRPTISVPFRCLLARTIYSLSPRPPRRALIGRLPPRLPVPLPPPDPHQLSSECTQSTRARRQALACALLRFSAAKRSSCTASSAANFGQLTAAQSVCQAGLSPSSRKPPPCLRTSSTRRPCLGRTRLPT